MKPKNRRLIVLLLTPLFGLLTPAAGAENAATNPKDEATVKLDPFNVSAGSDIGFVAASSLAGGRIATALKDTPIAYSVVTSEFLDAFNITDVASASMWTPSANNMEVDNSQRLFARTSATSITLRGVKIGAPQQNYFPFYSTPDSYNIDRVDFPRGPNSVVIGTGAVGGVVNSVTKQALFNKPFSELRLQVGNWQHQRATIDVNRPLSDKLAVRANVLWDQTNTWRDNEWTKKYGTALTATYKFTPNLSVRAEVQYGQLDQVQFTLVQDAVSAWDGKSYNFSAPLTGAGAPTPAQLARSGMARITKLLFVTNPDFNVNGAALNFQNNFQTAGAAANSTVANSNWINGVQIKTVGFSNNGQPIIDNNDGISLATRFAPVLGGSPHFQVPGRSFTTLWSGNEPSYTEASWNKSLFLNYHPTEDLYIEIAGNHSRSKVMGNASQRRGLTLYQLDISPTLPNGAPNANFLRPYTDYMQYKIFRTFIYQTLRAQAIYSKDTRLGKFQFGGVAGLTVQNEIDRARVLMLPITNNPLYAPDARAGLSDTADIKNLGLFTRYYAGQDRTLNIGALSRPLTLVDPVTNTTGTVTPQWNYDILRNDRMFNNNASFKYLQIASNIDLFKNRLVLIGAARRDFTRLAQLQTLLPGDMAAGYDGQSFTFKPAAPTDYFDLVYNPKDATGRANGPVQGAAIRPRASVANVSAPLAQYSRDRFQDDYSPPTVTNSVNTFTLGAVVNVTRAIGVYSNVATTFDLSSPAQLVDGRVAKPSSSRGTEYGVRATLPNGRMSFSFGRFTSAQKNAVVTLPGSFSNDENNIAGAAIVGDLSAGGANVRGLKTFTSAIRSVVTNASDGYEAELTANFTRNWRVTLNASQIKSVISNQYPDVINYLKQTDSVVRQILGDAGVVIDAQNVARINPALDDPTKINQAKVLAAVAAWNDLQTVVIPTMNAQVPQDAIGAVKYTANLGTDFRFESGPVKGLRVGFGVQYRTGPVVGYRGSDTIVSPNNPNVAIDDPTVGAATSVYGTSYYKGVASLSYTVKLKDRGKYAPKTMQFDFNVDNLFDRRDPIFANVGNPAAATPARIVPRNGDFSSPAGMTVAGDPGYLTPRGYSLSAKLSF